jgi:hypothetical protein
VLGRPNRTRREQRRAAGAALAESDTPPGGVSEEQRPFELTRVTASSLWDLPAGGSISAPRSFTTTGNSSNGRGAYIRRSVRVGLVLVDFRPPPQR